MNAKKQMLVILTNIPTPYRTNFFNVLNQQLAVAKMGFHVLYCAETEPNRSWQFYPGKNNYSYTFLKGLHLNAGSFYPHFNPAVISSLKKLKPSCVIVAGSWNTPTMILATLYLKFSDSKTIFWSEGHVDSVGIKKGLIPYLRKKIYSLFDAFAVPNKKSEDYVNDYLAIKNKNFIRLPNTVNDDFFLKKYPLSNESTLRKKFDLSGKKIAVQVAQLEDRKGVVELVNGWLNVDAAIRKNWVLSLVGNGNKLDEIVGLINAANGNDTIKLLGEVNPEEVRDILHIADLFILATKSDPNPLSPIEAAFAGLPLIVSAKAGNVAEILQEGINGYVLHEVNPSAITKILSLILSKEEAELKLMGLNSQKIALQNFNTAAVVDNLIICLKNSQNFNSC